MVLDQQTDSGKDKRLLVLLAFGLLVVLVSFPPMAPDRRMENTSWGWVEYAGEGDALQRVLLSENDPNDAVIHAGTLHRDLYSGESPSRYDRNRTVAVLADGKPFRGISPRLALLLGLPFPVNRASADELTLLQGIGPKLAANIVDYRERHGHIADVQELREIPGIGRQLTNRIGPLLSFD